MKKSKLNFYLNPHDEYKWTKCPKCENGTKLRKFCLMIHYEEKSIKFHQLISLKKSCKFCPNCELLIAQKSEIEHHLHDLIQNLGIQFNANNYFVFGTIDRKDWKIVLKEPLDPGKALEKALQFKDIWDFEIRPAGWYFEGE